MLVHDGGSLDVANSNQWSYLFCLFIRSHLLNFLFYFILFIYFGNTLYCTWQNCIYYIHNCIIYIIIHWYYIDNLVILLCLSQAAKTGLIDKYVCWGGNEVWWVNLYGGGHDVTAPFLPFSLRCKFCFCWGWPSGFLFTRCLWAKAYLWLFCLEPKLDYHCQLSTCIGGRFHVRPEYAQI